MNRKRPFSSAMTAALAAALCMASGGSVLSSASNPNTVMNASRSTETPESAPAVREPAVAGLFYPAGRDELSQTIARHLVAAPAHDLSRVRALVCPHAGYPYSGPVAAHAYKNLPPDRFRTVVVMAPSHYAMLRGVSVCRAGGYKTPLGTVPMSGKAAALAGKGPFQWESPLPVKRPQWWRQAAKTAPGYDQDTPETWEHSGEVQVPFLQKTLRDFQLVSLVFGETDPAAAARHLEPILDDGTLLVASSDLSHYHPYETAEKLDRDCVRAVCGMDFKAMEAQEACGRTPVLTLMHIARNRGWKPVLLDYRNSGDTSGDKSGVVGYAAIAFLEQISSPAAGQWTDEEKKFLLDLAETTVRRAVAGAGLPSVDKKTVPPRLTETKGCFVTLTKRGELRGCIGHILPQEPLYEAVMDNARSAALHDTRFAPVEASELDQLEYEISVLTEPEPLPFGTPEELLARLRPGTDGVVLRINGRTATFLPQVWEQLPDKTDFLNHLARKSGNAPDDWRKPGCSVQVYQVEHFRSK